MRLDLRFESRRSGLSGIATMLFIALAIGACGSKTESTGDTAPPQGEAPAAAPGGAAVPPPVPAPAVTQASWAPGALEELLAPIALYPDQLVGQILAASVNSQEVLDAGNWLLQNENLTGNELDAAAEQAGFGPAMRALVQFPSVVDMMCQQIDWTRQLGSAFTSDQKGVLDAVQRLRAQAVDAGNLESTKEQTVETKTENNQQIVEVKPADPKVVYVPVYDPQVVYTTPPPAPTTTTTTSQDTVSTGAAVAGGLIAFGLGIAIGNAFDDDDYYYPHWGYGSVYYGPRPFYPPAYVYRPAYGPAFRPAYGYVSPPGYRYNYNHINVQNNININVDNNYFNRFEKNQNLRAGNTNSPIGGSNRAGQGNESWKGRSTYQGAKNPATAQRLNQAAGGHLPNQSREVGGAGGTRNEALAQRSGASHTNRAAHADRGYGTSNRPAAREHSTPQRTHTAPTTSQRPVAQRATEHRPATQQHASPARHDNAFSGAPHRGSGSFDRAASARGHASVGHGGGARGGAAHGGRRR